MYACIDKQYHYQVSFLLKPGVILSELKALLNWQDNPYLAQKELVKI